MDFQLRYSTSFQVQICVFFVLLSSFTSFYGQGRLVLVFSSLFLYSSVGFQQFVSVQRLKSSCFEKRDESVL